MADAPAVLSEAALTRWGRELGAEALRTRAFVCLYGPLGAGKSTLARAACAGAGVGRPVPSPTFILVQRYRGAGGVPVWHADLYRLGSPEELWDLGWPELLEGEGPAFVEWAERAAGQLPADRWEVELGFLPDPARRRAAVRAVGGAPPPPPLSGGAESA